MKRALVVVALLLPAACGTDTIVAVRESRSSGPRDASVIPTADAPSGPAPDAPSVPTAPGYYRAEGGRIVDSSGNPVTIRAVSWYGFETPDALVHGLWARPLDDILQRIEELGFDTVRLPFSSELFAGGAPPQTHPQTNPELVGLNRLQTFLRVIERAGAHGLKVILVHHRSAAGDQKDLWYTPEYDEARWIDDWKTLAFSSLQNRHVIGFELHCDTRGRATWGDDDPETDWRLAAERAGNAVLSINPNLLIFVSGVQFSLGFPYVWGGNLRGARAAPVRLTTAGRLVYAAADYPKDTVVPQYGDPANYPWLLDPSFPANLSAVWDENWGYLVEENLAPVVLTSFGGRYESSSDRAWFDALVPYVKRLGIGFAYWTLNEQSNFTGGLFLPDWNAVNEEKYRALAPLLDR